MDPAQPTPGDHRDVKKRNALAILLVAVSIVLCVLIPRIRFEGEQLIDTAGVAALLLFFVTVYFAWQNRRMADAMSAQLDSAVAAEQVRQRDHQLSFVRPLLPTIPTVDDFGGTPTLSIDLRPPEGVVAISVVVKVTAETYGRNVHESSTHHAILAQEETLQVSMEPFFHPVHTPRKASDAFAEFQATGVVEPAEPSSAAVAIGDFALVALSWSGLLGQRVAESYVLRIGGAPVNAELPWWLWKLELSSTVDGAKPHIVEFGELPDQIRSLSSRKPSR